MTRRHNLPHIAFNYWELGWNPFPLPPGAKYPPPSGVTGERGRAITKDDLADWAHDWANIGLVMSDGVVGLDIDAYKHDRRLPEGLPPTVRTTNREDGSGIYMFTVAKGTKLQGTIPDLGEVIQRHHRYAVVWPSIHPEGRPYVWLDDDDYEVGIPDVDDLPQLPETWLKRLQDRPASRRSGKGFKGDAEAWFDTLQKGPMTPAVRAVLRESARELERHSVSGEARYDVMVRGIGRLVGLGARRDRGVERAIDELYAAYVQAVEGTLGRDPESEIARALTGAIEKWGAR